MRGYRNGRRVAPPSFVPIFPRLVTSWPNPDSLYWQGDPTLPRAGRRVRILKGPQTRQVRRRAARLRREIHTHAAWVRSAAPMLVVVATFLAFLPSLSNEFVNFDDDANFLNNPHYRGLGPAQLRWMFTTLHMGMYMPLPWVTLGLDYLFWGMNPLGYHLTSLILHVANAWILYFIALRLLGMRPGAEDDSPAPYLAAAVSALLFALHPLRVESVAWVTERRDVLCGFFYLATMLAYLRACDRSERRPRTWYWLSVLTMALALLSKPMAVSLPVVLVVLDIYPLGQLPRSVTRWPDRDVRVIWAQKVPFILLSLAAAVGALISMNHVGHLRSVSDIGIGGRIGLSLYSIAFYLSKTLVPTNLSPLYELPARLDPLVWRFVASGLVVVAMTALAVVLRRRCPGLAAVWVTYVVMLLPVSGIVHNGPQIAADRYTYLPMIGWAILAGAGLRAGWEAGSAGRLPGGARSLFAALTVTVVVAIGSLTLKQVQVWHDTESLWRHALAASPSALAHSNLAAERLLRQALREAVEHARRALEIRPDYVDAHNVLGLAFMEEGRAEEAKQAFSRALEIDPRFSAAHNNLGVILAAEGRRAEAIEHFRAVVHINPNNAGARKNLADTLMLDGQTVEALDHLRQFEKLKAQIR